MQTIYRVFGWLIWCYALLVRITSRWDYEGTSHRDRARAHGRVIYAFWHQDGSCFCAAMAHENSERLSLLVLGGRKVGAFMGYADLARFRIHPTLPDEAITSAALEGVQRDIFTGCWSAITPDGPRGPARACKPGVVRIARAVDGIVLPLSISCSRFMQTRNWDGARVPLPFARFVVRFGAPVKAADWPDDELLRRRIEGGINACTLWRPASETRAL
jgi:3-deoxy-D-manno-octulosonic-acid transferase